MHKKQIMLYGAAVFFVVVLMVFLIINTFSDTTHKKSAYSQQQTVNKTIIQNDHQSRLAARRKRLRNRKNARHMDTALSDKGLVEIDAISDQLKNVTDAKEKINLLDQLWDVDDPSLPKLVAELLNDKNKEVRLAAMELLDGKTKGEILNCIDQALDDPDKNVREVAVVLLSDINEPLRTQNLLVKGVEDAAENVRAATFDVVGEKPISVQQYVYTQSILSQHDDVKEKTVDLIMDIPSPQTVEILFQGLNDSDNDFRELLNSKMDFLFSKEFKNSDDALAWWGKNKHKYDDELFEK